MRRYFPHAIIALTLASGIARPGHAQQLTTTNDPPLGFGQPLTTTWVGETFLALNSSINSYGFYLDGALAPWPVGSTFRTELWAWNGVSFTGSPLFTSPIFGPPLANAWMDFATGNLPVISGGSYAALFEVVTAPVPGNYYIGAQGLNPYADGGEIARLNNTPVASGGTAVGGAPWGVSSTVDIAFRATFASPTAVVPEPGSIVLLASGMVVMVARVKRKRTTNHAR